MTTTRPPTTTLALAAAAVVGTVAGLVGLVMLVAPGATDVYFAWPLRPPALAALVGGFYLASGVVFAYAARLSVPQVRGLAVAVLAFTLPTLAATLIHRETFDFGRLVAIAWVVLFVASPITFGALLWAGRHVSTPPGPRLGAVTRSVLGALSVALAALALTFWTTTTGPVPFEIGPLAARFLAAWLAFLAVLAAWPALRPSRAESRLPLQTLVAYPVGGLIAAIGHIRDLGGGTVGYLLALAVVAGVAATSLATGTGMTTTTSGPA